MASAWAGAAGRTGPNVVAHFRRFYAELNNILAVPGYAWSARQLPLVRRLEAVVPVFRMPSCFDTSRLTN
jgi:hypothetical protein